MRRIYTSSWRGFFRDADRVVVLPSWAAPRLYIVSESAGQRWRDAGAFYPAVSWKARLFKTLLRGAVAAIPGRFGLRRPVDPDPSHAAPASTAGGWRDAVAARLDGRWPAFRQSALARSLFPAYFVRHGTEHQAGGVAEDDPPAPVVAVQSRLREWFPGADGLVLMVGAADDNKQKLIARLRDRKGRITGFAKFACLPLARELIRNERKVLSAIPANAGPRIAGFEDGEHATVLAMTPVEGRTWPARLPDGGTASEAYWTPIRNFLVHLATPATVAIEDHPVRKRVPADTAGLFEKWLPALQKRRWPVVVEHGDFTPWNLFRTATGTAAIDWEDGDVEGFPYLDLVFWILQTGYFLHHWTPRQAFDYAAGQLRAEGLDAEESAAVIRLAALLAHAKSRLAGLQEDGRIQTFRREMWSI